ncbi:lecithin retinol acyltransferase family protein [Solibacillus sp. CAU 1738]
MPTTNFFDIEPQEIWEYITPVKGNHIRVSRGLYTHHGVYISNNEVIHFTGQEDDNVMDWSKNEVIQSTLERFLLNGKLEVKLYTDEELNDVYPVDEIVQYARHCIGDQGYNLIFNNCEHFANVCTLGRFKSHQVEKVLGGVRVGILGKLGTAIKGLFGGNKGGGSRSTSTTTYEPDKVKVTEIEKETKLRLAGLENERIELAKDAQLELMEKQLYCQEALIEAQARGLAHTATVLVSLGEQLNELTKQRLEIIESGSMQFIQQYEEFYGELHTKIREESDQFVIVKMPELAAQLERFEPNSSSARIFEKSIDQLLSVQMQSFADQLAKLNERHKDVHQSVLQSKQQMLSHSDTLTLGLLEHIQQQQVSLGYDKESRQALLQNTEQI